VGAISALDIIIVWLGSFNQVSAAWYWVV